MPHAARRRRRHLRRGRGDALAQGQGRGARGAAAGRAADAESSRWWRPTSAGSLRQRRTGLGWRVGAAACPRRPPSRALTVLEVHEAFERSRPWPAPGRSERAGGGDRRAVRPSHRRGAAVAARCRHRRGPPGCARRPRPGGPGRGRRRAAGRRTPCRDAGRLRPCAVAAAALEGGEAALAAGRARGRPPGHADARLERARRRGGDRQGRPRRPGRGGAKLDGIRIQVHRRRRRRRGGDPHASRHHRAGCPRSSRSRGRCRRATFVLDGEALALDDDGRPRPSRRPRSRTAQSDRRRSVTPYFFDLLHVDGRDLLDCPGARAAGGAGRPGARGVRVPRVVTSDPAEAEAFSADVLAPATRASSSRTSRRPTTRAAAARPGSR